MPFKANLSGGSWGNSFGQVRQFSVEEIFKLFCQKYKNFPCKLTTFRQYIPKNLVAPSLRDFKQNTRPLHENLRRSIAALNRFFIANKAHDLLIPTSTISLSLLGICKPPDNLDARNPLHWNMNCTKGTCNKCGFNNWFNSLLLSVKEKNLSGKNITYSNWVTEYDEKSATNTTTTVATTTTTPTTTGPNTTATELAGGEEAANDNEEVTPKKKKKKQSKVVLRKFTVKIEDFLVNALMKSLSTTKLFSFPEHLRKAWKQWELTKELCKVNQEMLQYGPKKITSRI